MSDRIVLTAFGGIDAAGFGSQCRREAWRHPDEARDLRWRRLFDQPFDRFGRLDALCKHALVAVELLGIPPPPPGAPLPDVGLALGTGSGSLAVDLAFFRTVGQPGGASPTLFSYTLPSTAIGEIAIRHRIGGPHTCFLGGAESGLLALWEGTRWIEEGEAEAVLCVHAEAPPEGAPFAIALFIETARRAERHGRTPLAELRIEPADAPGRPWTDLPAFLASGPSAPELLYLAHPAALSDAARALALTVDRRRHARAGAG